jgi:hypothetical protein
VYALLASRLKDIPEDAAFQVLSALPSLSLARIFGAAPRRSTRTRCARWSCG